MPMIIKQILAGSETRDTSSTPASAVIYDAYNSIMKKESLRTRVTRMNLLEAYPPFNQALRKSGYKTAYF